jgi:hypothetical protein
MKFRAPIHAMAPLPANHQRVAGDVSHRVQHIGRAVLSGLLSGQSFFVVLANQSSSRWHLHHLHALGDLL